MAKNTAPKSTTIRVDSGTHERLMTLADELNTSIVDIVRRAIDAMERKKFRQDLARYYEELRKDPEREERETKEDSEWLLGTVLTDDWNEEDNDPSNW
jgi:predicted transcriptional regulator